MKEILLTSTLPYWLVFLLVLGGFVALLFQGRNGSKSNLPILTAAGCMLAATILEVLIYAIVGNNCMWWCLSKEYGFWSKLFRIIPFAVFVVLQIGQIFMFKGVLEEMMGKSLSMKLLFICFVLTFPVVFVLSVGADIFGASDETKNSIGTTAFWILVIAGLAWSLVRNIMSVGIKHGVVFTVFSAVCVVAVCLAVFVFLVALIALFFQVLITVAACGAIFFILTNGMGKGSSMVDEFANHKSPGPVFRDDDGHLHHNSAARDSANRKIAERRNGES
ncbi:hypothetical protein [Xylanibacter rarus]|jgi:hypothetical protein|uniref:Uncharacterized protein n=1 Tax=Xylanibacter rarus TaxID=1676614 RepID=A0A8E1QWH8_9BACT|nr:hypothetical protein [Xylanibacter rarus]KOO67888.1 hypothetical protein ACU52_10805 [Xylanibacter rarus]